MIGDVGASSLNQDESNGGNFRTGNDDESLEKCRSDSMKGPREIRCGIWDQL